ncbi:MAG: M14 family metallopeptidase [Bacteroidetes bacterium]|nr:M14 family metallopeptidase [Bacteroidota bacterium]MCW5894931.1 M14 family metallopeptidase [Bacteroidota bacterium]
MNFPPEYLTHFEHSNFLESPGYDDTMKYFSRFEHTGKAEVFTFGMSPQGRELKFIVIGKDGDFTPHAARANGKAVVMIQNGIHAGEIEGKDACMLMMREMLITGELAQLLDHLVLVIIPILNVDGHERTSQFNRPNQNGPSTMGWRTTSWNLNLNRDYMKADAPEMRALLRLYQDWQPDFTIDNHTTDGADFQYHIMFGMEKHKNVDAGLAAWGQEHLMPFVTEQTEAAGFLTGPYFELQGDDIREGFNDWPALPRYSTGYAAVHNRLCLLVETHSLKPFKNRVYSTKAMNVATLEFIHTHYNVLRDLNYFADSHTVHEFRHDRKPFPLVIEGSDEFEMFRLKGFETTDDESEITGSAVPRYSAVPTEFDIPFYNKCEVKVEVDVPFAYAIPREFSHLADILRLHGVEVHAMRDGETLEVELYKFIEVEFASKPYEGRQRVECGVDTFIETVFLPPGTFIVYTQQRTLRLIMHLLEPQGPDSFVSWGFFNAFFERKEYAEPYIMEPIAKKMLDGDPELRREFEEKLEKDAEFAADPAARLNFFYERSPYFDTCERVYPFMRIPHKS